MFVNILVLTTVGFVGRRQVLLLAFEDKSQRYCYVFYKTEAPATTSSFSHHHYPKSLSKTPMVQRLKILIYGIKCRHLVLLSSTSKNIPESLVKHQITTYLKQTNKQKPSKLESTSMSTNSHCDCKHTFSP